MFKNKKLLIALSLIIALVLGSFSLLQASPYATPSSTVYNMTSSFTLSQPVVITDVTNTPAEQVFGSLPWMTYSTSATSPIFAGANSTDTARAIGSMFKIIGAPGSQIKVYFQSGVGKEGFRLTDINGNNGIDIPLSGNNYTDIVIIGADNTGACYAGINGGTIYVRATQATCNGAGWYGLNNGVVNKGNAYFFVIIKLTPSSIPDNLRGTLMVQKTLNITYM